MKQIDRYILEKLHINKDSKVKIDDEVFWNTLYNYESGNIETDVLDKEYKYEDLKILNVDAKGTDGDNKDWREVSIWLQDFVDPDDSWQKMIETKDLDNELKLGLYKFMITNNKH
jgi:hypothetical protein